MSHPFTFAVSAGGLTPLSDGELAVLSDILTAAAGAIADRLVEYENDLRGLAPSLIVLAGVHDLEEAIDAEQTRVQFERASRRPPLPYRPMIAG